MLCQEIHAGRVVLWSRGWRVKEEHQAQVGDIWGREVDGDRDKKGEDERDLFVTWVPTAAAA